MNSSPFPEGDEHPYNTDPEKYVVPLIGKVHWDPDCGQSPSRCVVAALRGIEPGIQVTCFRKCVLRAIWDDAIKEAFDEEGVRERYLRRLRRWTKHNAEKHLITRCEILDTWKNRDCRFVPDAFLLDAPNKTVVCYEVEDRHPLNPWSIGEYCAAWWCLEYIYWDLHLIAYDVYGNWRIVHFPHSDFIARKLRSARKAPPA
jgi:hypothetical protein